MTTTKTEAADPRMEEFDCETDWPASTKVADDNINDNGNDNYNNIFDTTTDLDEIIPSPASVATTTRTVFHPEDNDDEPTSDEVTKKQQRNHSRVPVWQRWTDLTENFLMYHLRKMVVQMAVHAATYPITYIVTMTVLSLAFLAIGFLTNFTVVVDADKIFTPSNSKAIKHHEWLINDSGFANVRPIMMILHARGHNVLDVQSVEKLFDAVNVVRDTPGYDELCAQGRFVDANDVTTCYIMSATRFWDHNETLFQDEIMTNATDDIDATAYQRLVDVMSQDTYRDGTTPVFHESILGNYERSNQTLTYNATTDTMEMDTNSTPRLFYVASYVVRISIPDIGKQADDFEKQALANLNQLKRTWEAADDGSVDHLELDFLSIFAYKIENQRAIIKDLPLVSGIFLVLIVFTTLIYRRRDPVQSRSMIGLASLTTIGLSLCVSYGWVWMCGIPFTSMAQILPFMIMGVGLDDTFIITGAYFRTNPQDNVVKRVEETMDEVCLSITMTSVTTMLAFVSGATSQIPGVRWLCTYGFAAVFCDYIFQVTMFIAFVVLDERRVQANRSDCCIWRVVNVLPPTMSTDHISDDDANEGAIVIRTSHSQVTHGQRGRHFSERMMERYADFLMKPMVKIAVLVLFAGLVGVCTYSAALLKQEFNVEDYVPRDSYLRGTLDALDNYYSLVKPIEVYFRGDDIDQSDPITQQQMRDYITDLARMPQINEEPPFCWVRDFPKLADRFPQYSLINDLPFNQKLDIALANPTVREIYGQDIVRDENGNITASRCLIFLRELDLKVVRDQMDFLQDQRKITAAQPINVGRKDWDFFTFDNIYFYWELYLQAIKELINSIIQGVVAVTIVAFLMMPHWSAAIIVCPNIMMVYINFLGIMQFLGFHINSLTYILIVMSIGLLCDFLMHILLRYYETNAATREDKVRETLRTMGASMLVSGSTTFLGVSPLVLSTTTIFMTVFWSFLVIVLLGLAHGLILMPVLLSLIGPLSTHIQKTLPEDYEAEMTDPSSSDDEEARISRQKHGYNRRLTVEPLSSAADNDEAKPQSDFADFSEVLERIMTDSSFSAYEVEMEPTLQLPNVFADPKKAEALDADNSDVSSLFGLPFETSAASGQPKAVRQVPLDGAPVFDRKSSPCCILEYIELQFGPTMVDCAESVPPRTPHAGSNGGSRLSYGQLQSPANTIHPAPSDELEERYKKRRRGGKSSF